MTLLPDLLTTARQRVRLMNATRAYADDDEPTVVRRRVPPSEVMAASKRQKECR